MLKHINSIKFEKLAFFAVVIINLFPILFTQFAPTLDGPAHLYNSKLIGQLLFGSTDLLKNFYKFTTEPVPNWSGHFMLSLSNLFLPAYVSEKIFIICYAAGLPLAFRYFVKSINPDNYFFCYLIFPFVYSFPYFLGFFNFCIGLVFLFLTLGFWINRYHKQFTKKEILLLFLLFTLTYFSHVFVFVMLLFIIGIHLCVTDLIAFFSPENNGLLFKNLKRKIGILLLTALLPIIFTIYYFYTRSASATYTYVATSELIAWLKNLRVTIVFNIIDEEKFTKKINYVLAAIFIIALYNRITLIDRQKVFLGLKSAFRALINPTDSWLVVTAVFLIMYFKFPDADGSAGYVSIRLGILVYLFLIVWICSQPYPRWLLIVTIPIVLFYNLKLNNYYTEQVADLNETAQECYEVSKLIKPNSIVLPLNYSDEWMKGHFSNYMGTEKPMVILENYELGTGYFPLKWNDDKIPASYVGESPNEMENCVNWRINSQNEATPINYIFILGNIEARTDDCTKRMNEIIKKHYTEIYSSMECRLLERK